MNFNFSHLDAVQKSLKNGATSNGQWYAVSSSTSRIFTASNSISAFIFLSHTDYSISVLIAGSNYHAVLGGLSSGRCLRVNLAEVSISDMFYVLNKPAHRMASGDP